LVKLKRLMTVAAFHCEFSISRSAVYREASAGRLRLTKVGRSTRIAAEDAEAWLQAHRAL
jgi:excisionase family DNA binding protein